MDQQAVIPRLSKAVHEIGRLNLAVAHRLLYRGHVVIVEAISG